MYKSPIDLLVADIQHQFEKQQDEEIYKAVVSVGINVDKDELIRALRDDRRQYEEGYRDGRLSAMEEIVRCKDCKHYVQFLQDNKECRCTIFSGCYDRPYPTEPNDFCSYGERRTDNG